MHHTERIMKKFCVLVVAVLLMCAGIFMSAQSNTKSPLVRRVITGSDAEGRSYIVSDERAPPTGGAPNLFHATALDPLGKGVSGDRRIRPAEVVTIDLGPGGNGLNFWHIPPNSPPTAWHRTATLDYDMLISGSMVLSLDKAEITLQPGDVVMTRNVHHQWRNPSATVPAAMWTVNVALSPS